MAETLVSRMNETTRLLLTRTGQGQADLASHLGLSRASVSHRLGDRHGWSLADVDRVADFFGLTGEELLSGYAAIAHAHRLPPSR